MCPHIPNKSILSTAVRAVSKPKSAQLTPLLKILERLPIWPRVKAGVHTLAYESAHNQRSLFTFSSALLPLCSSHTRSITALGFCFSCPFNLESHCTDPCMANFLSSFKSFIKSHLFKTVISSPLIYHPSNSLILFSFSQSLSYPVMFVCLFSLLFIFYLHFYLPPFLTDCKRDNESRNHLFNNVKKKEITSRSIWHRVGIQVFVEWMNRW